MAAQAVDWPHGLRSARLSVREAGFWPSLAAVLGGLLIPAAISFGLLTVAGTGGDSGLRGAILFVLYALISAPLPAFFLSPLLWALCLGLVAVGYAGLLGLILVANAVALPAAHLLLHGDVTSEAPWIMPNLVVAVSLQAAVTWSILWAILNRRRNLTAKDAQGGA